MTIAAAKAVAAVRGPRFSLRSRSPAATRAAAAALGRLATPGTVVCLRGSLGSGKTVFVQGLARGLGVGRGQQVRSPTFTLLHEYAGRLPVFHWDLYRIRSAEEWAALGWEEVCDGPGVTVLEWADRAGPLLPRDRVEVALAIAGPRERTLTFRATGRNSRALLRAWSAPRPL